MPAFDRRAFLLSSAAAAGVAGCAPLRPLAPLAAASPGTGAATSAAATRARVLYDRIFEEMLVAAPTLATSLGLDVGERAHLKRRLGDFSGANRLASLAPLLRAMPELQAIPRAELAGSDRAWLDTAMWFGRRAAETAAVPYGGIRGAFGYPLPYVVSQLSGSYQSVPSFLDDQHKIETAEDAEAYLERLGDFHRNVDAEVEHARSDAALGVIPPALIVAKALAQTRSLRAQKGSESGLVRTLLRKTSAAGIAGDWGARAARIVDGPLAAALDRQSALLDGWRARAGEAPGASRLPQGEAYYAQALRYHTSTSLSAAEIHRIGLAQVAELNAEAEPLLRAQGLTKGSVGKRITALGEMDKNLFANTDAGRAELLDYIRGVLTDLRGRMPALFRTLPTGGMEVQRVPPAIELGSPGAYAVAGSLDGTRPGIYYINLASTKSWPRWSLPTLTCHEAIPGHLWHSATVRMQRDIPMLFQSVGIPAFGEGWGLYAETLGDEVGLYRDDPLGRIGMIQSFLFRSARLVVDTGMHAMGWSRARAIDYFMDVVGRERLGTEREIDRYIVWPGQATSYKIGHNEMLRIREETKRRLGPRFDLKAYHDMVLVSGSMPLEVLAQMAREWDGA